MSKSLNGKLLPDIKTHIADYWSEWLIDAIATATQDPRYLRGEPEADNVAIDAIMMNGRKAILNALTEYD